MKIGIVSEGSYPYVQGGVSTWVHELISNLQEFEFEIYYIKPDSEKMVPKYEIPKNVTGIYELNIFGFYNPSLPDDLDLSPVEQIVDAITRKESLDTISKNVIELIRKNAGKAFGKFFESKIFWDATVKTYEKFFNYRGFTEYYWMVKNLLLPIFNSLQFIPDKCDIFHVPSTGYASLVGIVGKFIHNAPLIITEHGIYHREREREIIISNWIPDDYKPMWINMFKILSKVAYEVSDVLITLFGRNQMFQLELGADPKKMMIIPNGVDVEKLVSLKREKHEGFSVAFVGRITRIKDIKTLIKAFEIVKEIVGERRIKLLLIGPIEDDRYYKECAQLIEELNLEDYTEFLGHRDVNDYYPRIDLLALSSVSEGQPLVLLEAMAMGIPIVATDVGACRELVYDEIGQCGIIVPPKDYISMAKAILKIYEDKEMREAFSKNARKIVEKKYRLDLVIERYRNLYLNLLKRETFSKI
ncbi:GT4 family glycosyltransferase PelF [Thermotoga sp. KOL6]|uniref:GT4 family glycosyltransferase PelF n=1 Tax=Thermotoga sp. KOL6 TaxID=126741 RepID=UPI000C759230|nr:GT4 family glycosyltransferase PelF [Thermotoga sp. KOL6]PLV60331.1 glycosyl transferase family 1 [Thermotoga sp. KOL6]